MATKQELSRMPVKSLLESDALKKRFNDVLDDKAPQFISSLINVVNSSADLQKVDQMSVIQSAMVAASLDLPIDKNLGYMWLVPYKGVATPQIGYKGYIQLAQRTGQYKKMNTTVIYEGELGGWNALTEEFQYLPENKKSDNVIGYVGYFKLINGFEKTVFWTRDQIDEHRQRFSKMSGKKDPSGVWKSDFDAMALKTVMRNLLTKWGPMSVYMQKAIDTDEQVVTDEVDTESMKTVDDPEEVSEQDLLNSFNEQQTEGENNANSNQKEAKSK